ncbi:MAG: bifunctional precorrin-2 dehydrogenase/sirohydrochlorin ferrochelatase [Dehalococcoidia bacterium]
MAKYYPVYLNLQGRKCLVAGGGGVALRKVTALLEHGAEVTVVSPRLCAGLRGLAEEGLIKTIHRPYRTGDMKGASVAVVATSNRRINRSAAEEAVKLKVPVNVVDDPLLSDFIVPSVLRRGDLSIAVSTSAKSPALARKIRARLEDEFGEEYASLVTVIEKARSYIKKQGLKVGSNDWQKALDIDSMIALIREDRSQEAQEVLIRKLTKYAK